MGFFLKKVISELLMPLPGCLLLGVAGWIVWRRGRRPRLGQGLVAASLLLLYALSFAPLSDVVVRRLESRTQAFPGDSVDFVVVLAGGHLSDPGLPRSSWLSGSSLYRLTEGVAIATAQPWSRLVLSGYGGADPMPNAEAYREVASAMGFPDGRMVLEPRPRDTPDEAELLTPLLRGHRFALVTSATHMPRALALFRARGLQPIPAPTDYLAKEHRAFDLFFLFPHEVSLVRARLVWHEILGSIWARMWGDV